MIYYDFGIRHRKNMFKKSLKIRFENNQIDTQFQKTN